MVNELIDSICLKLRNTFPEEYNIYTEEVEQGLKEPCFFVFCINPGNVQVIGKRYLKRNLFCIQYLSDNEELRSDFNTVAEKLFHCLEYITLSGDLIRGTKMEADTQGEALSFYVNYDIFNYRTEEKENMEDLKVKMGGLNYGR